MNFNLFIKVKSVGGGYTSACICISSELEGQSNKPNV